LPPFQRIAGITVKVNLSGERELAGWCRNFMAKLLRGLDPGADGVFDIRQRFLAGLAVAHAAGQIRHGRDEPAAILGGQRFDDDGVVGAAQGNLLTASMKPTSLLT
jgi:hypothetical protein